MAGVVLGGLLVLAARPARAPAAGADILPPDRRIDWAWRASPAGSRPDDGLRHRRRRALRSGHDGRDRGDPGRLDACPPGQVVALPAGT